MGAGEELGEVGVCGAQNLGGQSSGKGGKWFTKDGISDVEVENTGAPGNFAMDVVRTHVVVSRGNGPWESSGRSESWT